MTQERIEKFVNEMRLRNKNIEELIYDKNSINLEWD